MVEYKNYALPARERTTVYPDPTDRLAIRNWKSYDQSAVYYTAREGEGYEFYISSTDANMILIDYTVKVKPNATFIVSAACKTTDVVDHERPSEAFGASIGVGDYNTSKGLVGSLPWTTLRVIGKADGEGNLRITFGLGYFYHVCTGEAFFKNLEITPVEEYVAEDTTWRFLGIVLANTSFKDENGVEKNHKMSGEEIAAATKGMTQTAKDLTTDSGGRLQAKMDVLVSYGLMDSYSHSSAFGYALSREMAYAYCVKNKIDLSKYDHVAFVMCQPGLPHSYFGLGGCFIQQYVGHSNVLYHDPQPLLDGAKPEALWTPGIYVHEFLHAAESYSNVLGLPHGELHNGEGYGYSPADGWRKYYSDYLQNKVHHEGKYVGIHPLLWKIPPHEFN